MTALVSPSRIPNPSDRWTWPIDPSRYDTAAVVRPAEKRAIAELGLVTLRRMARHDPDAPGWRVIRRLLRPLDDVAAALHEPATSHRRRGRLDAAAVVLLRCAETGRSYWAWSDEEWAGLLGKDLRSFRASVPVWAEEAVRPQLAAHAFLLGGFADFYKLGTSAVSRWPGVSSAVTAWTARSAGSAQCSLDGATSSAARTTSCCRWWSARSCFSIAARTWRT
ncbi:hypothetical protein AB0G85_35325 [Streptomyces sioyaensis]|uniref:hypothetical protein n=1 Tax=Streptomyces sioyaensis TaxID=67364 RepID=UPI0033E00503